MATVLFAVALTAGAGLWSNRELANSAAEALRESETETIPFLDAAGSVNDTARVLGEMLFNPLAGPEQRAAVEQQIARTDALLVRLWRLPKLTKEERTGLARGRAGWKSAVRDIKPVLDDADAAPVNPESLRAFTSLDRTTTAFEATAETSRTELRALLMDAEVAHDRAVAVIAATVLAALVGLLGALRLTGTLVRPVERLRLAANRIATGVRVEPLPLEGPAELAQLAESFNSMADDLRQREAEIVHQALHDPLTGLGNRVLLNDRLESALTRLRRHDGEVVALMVIDLDRFKNVNDTLGHSAGNEAISIAADRLGAQLRDGDTLSRLGGDQFAVLAEDIRAEAIEIGTRLRDSLREPFVVGGRGFTLSASVGIALADTGGESAEQLLRDADLAMYGAKQRGGDAVEVFDRSLHDLGSEKLELEADLRAALHRDELKVHYQPIVDVGTSRIVGVEALVRWQHPRRGLMGPAAFLPLAEETGLIVPLGRHVLRTAMGDVGRWRTEFAQLEPFTVSVNVSIRELTADDFVEQTRRQLAEAHAPPQLLTVEVTETAMLVDYEDAVEKLAALRGIGVRVALDDFGTGYSSLERLKELPVDVIKIDTSFITGIAHRSDLSTLVRTVLDLGRAFSLQVVAEGVEEHEDLDALRELGLQYAQGYWFARPLPADEMKHRLRQQQVHEKVGS